MQCWLSSDHPDDPWELLKAYDRLLIILQLHKIELVRPVVPAKSGAIGAGFVTYVGNIYLDNFHFRYIFHMRWSCSILSILL